MNTISPASSADSTPGPWHPGIASQVPDALRGECTILRPENVSTGFAKARELGDLTGLALGKLVAFRPQRMAMHELLVRVMADLSVPDGSKIEDLGINFREITTRILTRHVEAQTQAIASAYDQAKLRLAQAVEREIGRLLPWPPPFPGDAAPMPAVRPATTGWRAWLRRRREAAAPPESDVEAQSRLVEEWSQRARSANEPFERALCRALSTIVTAVLVRHGRAWGGRELVAALVVDVACNDFASDEIGRLVDDCVHAAVRDEGYMLLPPQARPVVLNTKGPSASGKSTLRPLQRMLAGDLGVKWSEFALISPDIWRKQLIDYGSLGSAFRYGGAFTGEELHLIDLKLDRYMARKALQGDMSHLLIDRFRFDSFAPDSNEAGSNLLTRFGQLVYLFFMMAPPEMLVERAWKRGLEVGRYKAVDDTLAHAVEAYAGMPELFFTWIERVDKDVRFEFLDNSVPSGERPLTVAFGDNRSMNVLDVGGLLDVERFCRIDIDATSPDRLYLDQAHLAPEQNASFLRQCVRRFAHVNFAEPGSGCVYLRLESGMPVWANHAALERAIRDPDTRAGLFTTVPSLPDVALPETPAPVFLRDVGDAGRRATLGRWG